MDILITPVLVNVSDTKIDLAIQALINDTVQAVNIKDLDDNADYKPMVHVKYKKSSYAEMFKVLQSFQKNEVFSDIKLKTDDGTILSGHKVVLASASPYFHAIFTNFEASNKDIVIIRELDSSTLRLLLDFIYFGEIIVTEKNVQVLLPAAIFLQLKDVQDVCCCFLQSQLRLENCLSIMALADLFGCIELLSSSKSYIQKQFLEVVDSDDFLSLTFEQLVNLISSDKLNIPSEEKIFECVIHWVKHDLVSRKCILPQLMEHVRLSLASKEYILKKVIEEPLLHNCLKCKDYIIEALSFHLQPDHIIIPQNIRTKLRQSGGLHKIILVAGGKGSNAVSSIEWYDLTTKRWQFGPEMNRCRYSAGLAVLKDNFVCAVGGGGYYTEICSYYDLSYQSVERLDLSSQSPRWELTIGMSVKRSSLGVGVIDNCLYAVGGFDGISCLNSAEVFDCSTEEWRMVSSMSARRRKVGVGVLNNLLYAVGGSDAFSVHSLKSVECYSPSFDTWTLVAEMCVCRSGAGIGVLDGVMYAVGGDDGLEVHKSVEAYRPSTGVWTSIADMQMRRRNPGVIALEGLLYVVGGCDRDTHLDSVEIYNTNTNTWSMLTASMNVPRYGAGVVVINRPSHF